MLVITNRKGELRNFQTSHPAQIPFLGHFVTSSSFWYTLFIKHHIIMWKIDLFFQFLSRVLNLMCSFECCLFLICCFEFLLKPSLGQQTVNAATELAKTQRQISLPPICLELTLAPNTGSFLFLGQKSS